MTAAVNRVARTSEPTGRRSLTGSRRRPCRMTRKPPGPPRPSGDTELAIAEHNPCDVGRVAQAWQGEHVVAVRLGGWWSGAAAARNLDRRAAVGTESGRGVASGAQCGEGFALRFRAG